MAFKQAPRTEVDGPVDVRRVSAIDDTPQLLSVSVTHNGIEHHLLMSEYNAARVFGSLAIMLKITLPPAVSKAIGF